MYRLGSLIVTVTFLLLTACSAPTSRDSEKGDFTIDELKQRAIIASEAGEYSDALLNYRKILTDNPDHVESLIGTGEILLTIGEPKRAEYYFARSLGLQPKNIDAREGRALAWLVSGNYADAGKSFAGLVEDGVERWRIWNSMGVIADLRGDYKNAADYYQRAITLAPERSMIKNNLGYSKLMSRDFANAEKTLTEALKSAPNNPRIVNNLAMAIAWQGRYEEAVLQLMATMGEAEAHNNIGYVAYLAGDYVTAEEYFRKAIRLKPNYYKRAAENLNLVLKSKKTLSVE